MPLAYGYIRFSAAAQEEGDSIRRQRDGILSWLKRNPTTAKLDTSLGDSGFYEDHRISGFAPTGKSRALLEDNEASALGEFMRGRASGRVQPGAYLIVESADRHSRESQVIALNLLTRLLMLDVVVVTLSPEMEYRTDADIGKLITIGVTMDRAHDESRIKNKRGKNAWKGKQANAKVQPLTSTVPPWCKLVGAKKLNNRLVGGNIVEDTKKADIVRKIFALANDGISCRKIARVFNRDKVPPLTRAEKWLDTMIYHVLTNWRVIGEYRPHTGRRHQRMDAARKGLCLLRDARILHGRRVGPGSIAGRVMRLPWPQTRPTPRSHCSPCSITLGITLLLLRTSDGVATVVMLRRQ